MPQAPSTYHIFIPSIGRAGNVKTLNQFSEMLRYRTTIVTRLSEERSYRRAHPDVGVVVCPVKGIHKTRQWILEQSKHEFTFMSDDDLTFHVRNSQDSGWKASPMDVVSMFQDQVHLLKQDRVACVGIANRFMINQIPVGVFPTGPYCTPMGFNLKRVNPVNHRFDRVAHYEDADMVVQLMSCGWKCLKNTNYFHSQAPSSGGAQLYRDAAKITASTLRMVELAPDYVGVKTNAITGAKTPVIRWKKLASVGDQ